jgi:hypothetical protein
MGVVPIRGDFFTTENTEATEPLTEGEERKVEECCSIFSPYFFFVFLCALRVLCSKSLFAPNPE